MGEPDPLRLEPRFAEAIWGGRRLADRLGKQFPTDRPIGESWEIFGANTVIGGRWSGRSLDEVARRDAAAVLGSRVIAGHRATDGFPLLIKFIDACLPLSVQVHPDDDYARQNEANSNGKTEAWYILENASDGELVFGLREGVNGRRVAESVASGELDRDLSYLRIQPGDAVFVPAGTVHAIGAGIMLYEVQQRSDITYRLYDWGRLGSDGRPRALHVEKALDVLRFPQPTPRTTPQLAVSSGKGAITYLAACGYFALVAVEGTIDDSCDGSTFATLSVVAGQARLSWERGSEDLRLGDSIVLPATLGSYRLEAPDGARVLRATVPDLHVDVIAPLVAAGYSHEEIARLGDLTSVDFRV